MASTPVGDVVGGDKISMGHIINSNVATGTHAQVNVYQGPPPLSSKERARLLAAYRLQVLEQTRFVNLRGIPLPRARDGRPLQLNVPLDKVYIQVQATEEKQRREQDEKERGNLEERSERKLQKIAGLEPDAGKHSEQYDIVGTIRELGEYMYRRGEVYQAEKRPKPVDPQVALEEHKRLVVLGAPGAGKSTLLRYLARRAAKTPDDPLPLLVSLRDYATALANNSTLRLREFALRVAADDEDTRRTLAAEIDAGHILWLVDALDEARSWNSQAAEQAGRLPGQLVLTSRPVGYVSTGIGTLPHFEILPLDTGNVDQFLHDWFGLLAEKLQAEPEWIVERVAWLQGQLKNRPRIQALTHSPLLLTFLVILAGEDPLRELSTQRSELYRRYIEELLDSWEAMRRPPQGATGEPAFTLSSTSGPKARRLVLEGFYYLGWTLHLAYYGGQPQQPPTRTTLAQTLSEYFNDLGQDALDIALAVLDFWQEAGLLESWHLHGQDYLTFRHLTFEEYAAAWGLNETWKHSPEEAWKFLQPRLHHYAWREPMLLLVGAMEDERLNEMVEQLLQRQSLDEDSLGRDLRLAGELLAEGAILKQEQRIVRDLTNLLSRKAMEDKGQLSAIFVYYDGLRNKIIDMLSRIGCPAQFVIIQDLQNNGNARQSVVFAPEDIKDTQPVPNLIQTPQNKNWYTHKIAASALTDIRDAQAAPALFQVSQEKDEGRKSHESVLEKTSDEQEIPTLIQNLRNKDSNVRRSAASALKDISDARVVPALIQALQDEDRAVRWNVAFALKDIGDARAVPALIRALRDEDENVRQVAVFALRNIGDVRAVPALTQVLRDKDGNIRQIAVSALKDIGDVQVVPALIQALQDEDRNVRQTAVSALKDIGDVQAVPALIQALQDEDRDIRQTAVSALKDIGDVQAVPALIQALQDEDRNVRRIAANALGNINNAQAVPALIQALQDDDKDVCQIAAHALENINDVQALPDLIRALQHKDEYIRWIATIAVGNVNDTRTVPTLIQALHDENWKVRQSAAEALGKIGDAQAVPALIQTLRDRDQSVRWSTISALGEIGDAQVVPALAQILRDEDRVIRQIAVSALKNIGDVRAVPALIQALRDKDWNVSQSAASALENIHDAQAAPALIQALQDKDWGVRRSATSALGHIGNAQTMSAVIDVLQDKEWGVSQSAVDALIKYSYQTNDLELAQRIAEALRSRLDPSEYEPIANHLSVLRAQAMPCHDPLLELIHR